MADLRSGLCHGPDCQAKITDGSGSDDFCSQACQARWQAALVGVPADSALVAETTAQPSIYQGDVLADLEAALARLSYPLKATRPAEMGEAATQSPTRRSWLARFWRWMWLRG